MEEGRTDMVTVAAGDGTERELSHEVWSQSEMIMEMKGTEDPISLADVGKDALDKVVEYMEQMAKFKADGTSEEDKQAWIDTYKKAFEPQDQLPLLVRTMNAANFMIVRTLLDELCKHVAEMVSKRTPNEILDYFTIKKDATEVEMLELIFTHEWIDRERLLIKELMEALLVKALLGKPELIEELLTLLERKPELNALLGKPELIEELLKLLESKPELNALLERKPELKEELLKLLESKPELKKELLKLLKLFESKPELKALLEGMKQILAQMQETSGPGTGRE